MLEKYNDLYAAHLTVIDYHGQHMKIKTQEHSVIGYKGDFFSIRGDSGSLMLMLERSLGVVGMIFGGYTTRNATYITLRSDLFHNIKERTGAVDIWSSDGYVLAYNRKHYLAE